jgi:hypothetical protein
LLKIAHELKKYLWQKLNPEKTQNVNKVTTNKQVGSLVLEVGTIVVAINNHMAIIQIQIRKHTIEDVLLDGGSGINIIIEQLRLRWGLPKPKPATYNLRMANQITTKPIRLIRDMKIYVHGSPYITIFTVLYNSVVDSNYSMLLGRPWLRDAKVAHDWGNNTITVQRNGIVRTITVTKHLGSEVRRPQVLLCYDYHNDITD